jgi:hypothetical protein
MEILISNIAGPTPVTVFHLKGDLTSENPLEEQARNAFEEGARNMVLDLTHVAYISSAGLRAIHTIYMLLRNADPEDSEASARGIARGTYKSPHLKLAKPSKNAMKALSMAGYDMFLDIHDSEKSAVASFA